MKGKIDRSGRKGRIDRKRRGRWKVRMRKMEREKESISEKKREREKTIKNIGKDNLD